jgi:hypothetical protein
VLLMNPPMKPRVSSIIWTDWPALSCAVSVPLVWIIGAAYPLINSSARFGPRELLSIAIPVSLLAALMLAWRINRVFRLFSHGRRIRGVIQSIRIVRDRGRLEFAYELDGQAVVSWTPIHKSRRVLELRRLQEVDVLVDPARPKDAIVAQLYV